MGVWWVGGGVCVRARGHARTHARTLVHDSAIEEDRRKKLQQEARFAANRVFR